MPHTPGQEFDQVVLEMIEHSPIGAVPRTPTHQDALTRLYATHQVYASADHVDGHVTVRSLARQPSFHAGNLQAVLDGKMGPEALEPTAAIFDRYVQSLPADRREKAEGFRIRVVGRPVHHRAKLVGEVKAVVAHDPVHTLFLVPGSGPHPGLPGNYLYGSVHEVSPGAPKTSWVVQLHDRLDGVALCEEPTLPAALARMLEVVASAPFHLSELDALGFRQG